MKTSALAIVLFAAACNDPTAGKPKAEVGAATTGQAASTAAGKVYAFSNSDSKIEWTGAKVSLKHDGSFQKFTGSINAVAGDPTKSSVKVEIDTASVTTSPDRLVGHLKTADFFDVEKFPKATFESTTIASRGASEYTITGNLDLHGVKKSISFPATIREEAGGAMVDATFSINRKDFGIVYPGKPDDLIADDVVIRLAIRAK